MKTKTEYLKQIEDKIRHDYSFLDKKVQDGTIAYWKKYVSSLYDEVQKQTRTEMREAITLQLREYANTPLSERKNGWEELLKLDRHIASLK